MPLSLTLNLTKLNSIFDYATWIFYANQQQQWNDEKKKKKRIPKQTIVIRSIVYFYQFVSHQWHLKLDSSSSVYVCVWATSAA